MHSKEFFYRAAGFVILGLPSFAVLPLLLYLVIAGTITVERLVGVCCTLVGVPVLAVCIACTVVWYRNSKQVWTVHNFYLKCPEMRSTLEFIFCNKRLVGSLVKHNTILCVLNPSRIKTLKVILRTNGNCRIHPENIGVVSYGKVPRLQVWCAF